jgi:hypothetical protein
MQKYYIANNSDGTGAFFGILQMELLRALLGRLLLQLRKLRQRLVSCYRYNDLKWSNYLAVGIYETFVAGYYASNFKRLLQRHCKTIYLFTEPNLKREPTPPRTSPHWVLHRLVGVTLLLKRVSVRLIGQTEGTLFVELSSLTNSVVNEQISLSDGTDANTIKLVIGSVIGGFKAEGKFGSVGQFGITKSTADFVSNKKIAIAYKANDFVFYYNGEQVGVDTGGSVPAMSAFAFSTGNSNFPATGNIKQVLLFKTRLSNSELAKLTSL